MLLESNKRLGALTGQRYKQGLDDAREVWLNGEKVKVLEHPAFTGIINTLSELYDQQHDSRYSDIMTYHDEDTGLRQSYSYLTPQTAEHLYKKRKNSECWAELTFGQLPRVPDFMSNVVVGLFDFSKKLATVDPRFCENVVNYYHYCAQADIAITHAIGDPQTDRSQSIVDNPDMALRVVKETSEGVVVRGAKQLATLAPVCHEILVYLSPSYALREKPEYVLWFALPIATPGMKILCREPHSNADKNYGHHFSRKFDEQDAMIFFDDVLVPWSRIFLLGDSKLALSGFSRINNWSLFANTIRFHQRLKTFISLASQMAKSIGVAQFRPIADQLGELVGYAEMIRLSIDGMQAGANLTDNSLLAPSGVEAPGIFAAQISTRIGEILRHIAASGLVMQPSEADLEAVELKQYLEKYMFGKDRDVTAKARLFRLAWDMLGTEFGARQEIYERWNRGDVVRNRICLYNQYDNKATDAQIEKLLETFL